MLERGIDADDLRVGLAVGNAGKSVIRAPRKIVFLGCEVRF
jgi:hypothetical protein